MGTIWCDRFKSVVVEDDAEVLSIVAAYIDLNPVRARIVHDPRDYRWSGFGEAMAGGRRARDGLVGLFPEVMGGYAKLVARYRTILYQRGAAKKSGVEGESDSGFIEPQAVQQVLQAGGKVSLREALACRWTYFSQGRVLGRSTFVQNCEAAVSSNSQKRPRGKPGLEEFLQILTEK